MLLWILRTDALMCTTRWYSRMPWLTTFKVTLIGCHGSWRLSPCMFFVKEKIELKWNWKRKRKDHFRAYAPNDIFSRKEMFSHKKKGLLNERTNWMKALAPSSWHERTNEKKERKKRKHECMKTRNGHMTWTKGYRWMGRLQCRVSSAGSAPSAAPYEKGFPTRGHGRNPGPKEDH